MTLFSIAQIDDYVKIFKERNSDFSGVSFNSQLLLLKPHQKMAEAWNIGIWSL